MPNTDKKSLLEEETLKPKKQDLNQKNIDNALNYFFSSKQCPIIINKILKNYTPTSTKKPRGFTFGLFKRILKYTIKHPKHAFSLLKLMRSPERNSMLINYYKKNHNKPALKKQLISLAGNDFFHIFLYERYKQLFTKYNLKQKDFKKILQIISTPQFIEILPNLLNHTKSLSKIFTCIKEKKFLDAIKHFLVLIEKEPDIKKHIQDNAIPLKTVFLQTKLLTTISPIFAELDKLPEKPTAAAIKLALNAINPTVFEELQKLRSNKEYTKLIISVLNLIKAEHLKESSELIAFLSSTENKDFLKQLAALMIDKLPWLASTGIPNNPELLINALSSEKSINTLINGLLNYQKGNKLGLIGNLTTAALDPNIRKGAVTGAVNYFKSFFWASPPQQTTTKPEEPSKIKHSTNKSS